MGASGRGRDTEPLGRDDGIEAFDDQRQHALLGRRQPTGFGDLPELAAHGDLGIIHREHEEIDAFEMNDIDRDLATATEREWQPGLVDAASGPAALQPRLKPRHEFLIGRGEAVGAAEPIVRQGLGTAVAELDVQIGIDDENRLRSLAGGIRHALAMRREGRVARLAGNREVERHRNIHPCYRGSSRRPGGGRFVRPGRAERTSVCLRRAGADKGSKRAPPIGLSLDC